MNFDFLENLELVPMPEKAKKESVSYPLEGDFRVKHNGEIIFSEDFRKRVGTKWLDFVFSSEWIQYPKDKPNVAFVIINDDEKAARADVKTEGVSTYLKERFPAKAQELWGIDMKEHGFVDFKLEDPIIEVKIAFIPKVVARGADKGKPDYERRENVFFMPFVPILDQEDEA